MALAYFITFSTYGTWLHGTEKGLGSVDRQHNQFGGEFVEPDAEREAESREEMTQPPYTMDAARRAVVRDAIVGIAIEKGWQLQALHVRSNHVHAVITADRDPTRLMTDLKARASRELTRAGFENTDRRRWTRHGSTKHLFTVDEVERKVVYTLDEQGVPMSVYDPRQEPRTQ